MFCQVFYGDAHYIFKSLKGSSGAGSFVSITVRKQQLEFHYYLLILYSVKFRVFIVRVSFITRVFRDFFKIA